MTTNLSQVSQKHALLLAPFAGHQGHLADRRARRFCNWLTDAGFGVTVVGALAEPHVNHPPPREYLQVPDPLRSWGAPERIGTNAVRARHEGSVRYVAARNLLVPDTAMPWSVACAMNSRVKAAAARSSIIVSTSPPESPHLAGMLISRRVGVPHVVDLRDGWIDEPLKEQIAGNGIRRWLETSLERAVLTHAALVLVTSNEWKELLLARMPSIQSKVHVLTNAYKGRSYPNSAPVTAGNQLPRLVYAGRFAGSRVSREPSPLVELLRREASCSTTPFEVRFVGEMNGSEIEQIEELGGAIQHHGWKVVRTGVVSASEAQHECNLAHGLLLLSTCHGSLPSKLFDYMATGRPILSMSPVASATWNACKQLPQAWQVDLNGNQQGGGAHQSFCAFLKSQPGSALPAEFQEDAIGARFRELVDSVLSESAQATPSTPSLHNHTD